MGLFSRRVKRVKEKLHWEAGKLRSAWKLQSSEQTSNEPVAIETFADSEKDSSMEGCIFIKGEKAWNIIFFSAPARDGSPPERSINNL